MDLRASCPGEAFWRQLVLKHRQSGLVVDNAGIGAVTAMCRGRLVYLATPYSKLAVDHDGVWRQELSVAAGQAACEWVWRLTCAGVSVVSPVVQAVEALRYDYSGEAVLDPLDAGFWQAWCRPMLNAADVLVIPPVDGWSESQGIFHEVLWFVRHNRPVRIMGGL